MEQPQSYPVIAVDGGGSRCRLALCDKDAKWQVEVGATNVSSNFDTAIAEITTGLNKLSKAAGWDSDTLRNVPTYMGLAGVTGAPMAERVAAALPLTSLKIEEDRAAALIGALGTDDGYLIHCGTGSFFGCQIDANIRFAGGWGPVLGDPGSAHWIGKQLLVRSLEAEDGLRQATTLSDATLQRMEGAAGLIAWAATAGQKEIAALAPLVTPVADHDALAKEILQDAASQLAEMLTAFGWTNASPLCLTGGIGATYARYLPTEIQTALISPLGSPLDGAIALAQTFAQGLGHEGKG
ncbi:BadF/BadG/BcrA/BcrD ATPase family protein [Epibacterium ulvae]|uniref:BadF/BadG/BcrA/BcrD ATPase family protein n=1 Tax=Epibacterium ulvae TaxID=1156985 RepID=UPI002490D2AE|nr:BadF/BadG/BcrA/BcrD ATPase family protein [Epibacterium ulvae]